MIHINTEKVDLLVIEEAPQGQAVDPQGQPQGQGQHYVWIKNFDTFCYRYSKNEHKKYSCRRCMKVYSSENLRKEHLKLCEGINKGAHMIQMPKSGEVVEFTDGHKLLKAPFIVYADFNAKKDDVDFLKSMRG